MCPEEPLYEFSGRGGLIRALLTMMEEGVLGEGTIRALSTLRTNHERVALVHKHIAPFLGKMEIAKGEGKCDVAAEKFRDYGDQKFENRQFREALKAYTNSVATANSRIILAKAYAHRSDLFHSLRMQKDCAVDIVRALNYDYPLHLSSELLLRLSRINNSEDFVVHHEPIPQIRSIEQHFNIQNASKCISIKEDIQMYMHVIANSPIKPGRVLAIESPFVSKVNNSPQFDHCHYCFKLCYSLIPCSLCTTALYCSDACSKAADDLYHRYECPVLTLGNRIGLTPDDILPFRMIFRSRAEYWKLQYLEEQLIYSSCHRSDRYLEMHNLYFRLPTEDPEESSIEDALNDLCKSVTISPTSVTKEDYATVNEFFDEAYYVKHDLLAQTVRCAIVYHFVKHFTDFFQAPPQLPEHLEKMFMEASMRLSEVCQRTATSIHEMTQDPINGFYPTEIGRGVYALSSIFTHSCHPNVMVVNYGSTRVYYSLTSIQRGEECCVSYNQMEHDYQQDIYRQKVLLEGHNMICLCQACVHDWPQINNLETKTTFGRSSRMVNLLKKLPQVSNAEEARALLPTILRGLSQTERHAPCRELSALKMAFHHCYSFFGNLKKML